MFTSALVQIDCEYLAANFICSGSYYYNFGNKQPLNIKNHLRKFKIPVINALGFLCDLQSDDQSNINK